jgi:L(+)-tartrate dehydratase beta subunit
MSFPATEEAIRELRAGDSVTVDGHIIGIRDRTQMRIFDEGVAPPMDLNGAFLLHTAPGVKKLGEGRYEKVCIGTTTSARMVRFTEPLGAQYGVRAICGKGGLPDEAIEPMQRLGMVYFAIVGGAAALETTQIEEIEEVAWEELMPECLWKFRVKDFGPLTVAIDSHGKSLYQDVQAEAAKRLETLYAKL